MMLDYSICNKELIGEGWHYVNLPSKIPFEITPKLPSADTENKMFPSGENSNLLHESS